MFMVRLREPSAYRLCPCCSGNVKPLFVAKFCELVMPLVSLLFTKWAWSVREGIFFREVSCVMGSFARGGCVDSPRLELGASKFMPVLIDPSKGVKSAEIVASVRIIWLSFTLYRCLRCEIAVEPGCFILAKARSLLRISGSSRWEVGDCYMRISLCSFVFFECLWRAVSE